MQAFRTFYLATLYLCLFAVMPIPLVIVLMAVRVARERQNAAPGQAMPRWCICTQHFRMSGVHYFCATMFFDE